MNDFAIARLRIVGLPVDVDLTRVVPAYLRGKFLRRRRRRSCAKGRENLGDIRTSLLREPATEFDGRVNPPLASVVPGKRKGDVPVIPIEQELHILRRAGDRLRGVVDVPDAESSRRSRHELHKPAGSGA